MERMIRNLTLIFLLAAALILLKTGPASALDVSSYPGGVAANGIAGSRHNLGDFGRVVHTVNSTSEICVFCHAPHHGGTTGPIWNRQNDPGASYIAYGTTASGTVIQNADIGGSTLACLSCHDGITQFDVLINAPGKGNNGSNSTAATDMNWNFQMTNNPGFGANTLDHFDTSTSGPCYLCHTAIFGEGNPADRLAIGQDLSNDHPVSVAYNASVASLRPTSTLISSIDLTSGLTATGSSSTNLQQNRWAVAGYIDNGTATIGALLRNGKVECVACHDPHFRNLSYDEVEYTWNGTASWCTSGEDCSDGNFLRRVGGNAGSGLCRTCHNK